MSHFQIGRDQDGLTLEKFELLGNLQESGGYQEIRKTISIFPLDD
ncbi:hypothetical protein THTE_1050 [Thermogutta terrifontis]|uniref:Uncharacterized protein n=1 Tax=Thermogutta terrifontis TaxID=1331910 RepID=A0A286RCG3_9BACT|nr:hypothetical protein THTE_1050 [Thermogutta terrifontis]